MASISARCISSSVNFSSCTLQSNRSLGSSRQPRGAQCFALRTVGDGLVGRGSGRFGLRRSAGQNRSCSHGGKREQHWRQCGSRAMAGFKDTAIMEQKWGPPISLGTAKLPQDVDLTKLQTLLYQVDRVEGGVRLGYIRLTDGKMEDLVHIDVLVSPASDGQPKAMFRALRNGQLKNVVPPGEPLIMQSLLTALKKSLAIARTP